MLSKIKQKIKNFFLAGLVIVLSFLSGKVRIRPIEKKDESESKSEPNE